MSFRLIHSVYSCPLPLDGKVSSSSDNVNNEEESRKNTKLDQLCQSLGLHVYSSSPPRAHSLIINELDSSPGGIDKNTVSYGNGNDVMDNEGFNGVTMMLASYPRVIERSILNAMFIAQHIDNADEFDSVSIQPLIKKSAETKRQTLPDLGEERE